MALGFKLRDMFMAPKEIIERAGIKPGLHVLDYGCGPGSYSMAAAEIVGESGKIYALDIHPLAVETVKHKAKKKGLENIETILSDCATGLPDESMDFVILFDIYHELSEPDSVLQELHRVLKPEGKLSFSDHHLKEGAQQIESRGLFRLLEKKDGKTAAYTFVKS
jgi:ubiquinone/menaquinone biosynthesis C-methylase UbiE